MDNLSFNDKYFPRIDLSNKAQYQYYKFNKKEFAYDKKNALLILLFKDPEEVEAMGKDAPYREMDAVGLRRENWRNKEVRDEYLWEYCMDLDEGSEYMAQDFIKNELPLYQKKDESSLQHSVNVAWKSRDNVDEDLILNLGEDTTSAIPNSVGSNISQDTSDVEDPEDEELIPAVDSDEDLEVLTEEDEELEIITELDNQSEYRPSYDYDDTDIVICNDPSCNHESVVYVAHNDIEAIDYIKNNGSDSLYVSLPDGGDILNAGDYLNDMQLMLNRNKNEDYNIDFNKVDDADDYMSQINRYIQDTSDKYRTEKGIQLIWRIFKQKMSTPSNSMYKVVDLSDKSCSILMDELSKMPLLLDKRANIARAPYGNEWVINISWEDSDVITENKTYEYKGYTINLYNGTSVWKDGEKVADNFSTDKDAEEYIDNQLSSNTELKTEGYKGLSIVPFREFKKEDYYSYGGASNIGNDKPLIYSNDVCDIIICGDEDDPTMCDIQVFLGEEGDIVYGSNVRGKTPMSFPKALRLAKELAVDNISHEDAVYWCDEHLEEF